MSDPDPSAMQPDAIHRSRDLNGQTRVVGVGTSAGGLQALTPFLEGLTPEIDCAIVIVQHLDPHQKSLLPELLSRKCALTILEATDGLTVQPNHVYVITPNTTLSISHGVLHTTPREQGNSPHLCINTFLESLAHDLGAHAVGILLSGAGSDGTEGLAAIKAVGGKTFAQDSSAEHQAMPKNAIAHGSVDTIASPEVIAQHIMRIARGGESTAGPVSDETPSPHALGSPPLPNDPASYAIIMGLLHQATGIDFSHYRSGTILRRTARRMALASSPTLALYCQLLANSTEEIESLARDILIHVTSFYRDNTAYDILISHVFPTFLHQRHANLPIRLWVVGCSTGQEVYSLAMELTEFLLKTVPAGAPKPLVQIFATDISEWALNTARIGWYPESISDQVPADRLERYFTRQNLGFRITKTIRDQCVFAQHDVTADVPFSHIDLVSCRNVLIYLGPELQRRVLPIFHFSLRPGAFLLLGASESIGQSHHLFEPTDNKNRLYHSLPATGKSMRSIVSTAPAQPRAAPIPTPSPAPISDNQRTADQIILSRYAPASVLVTPSLDILQYRGDTTPFLQPAAGDASLNLLTMIPFGVAETLREVMAEATERGLPIRRDRIMCRRANDSREIGLEVIPVHDGVSAASFLILFSFSATSTLPSPAIASPATETTPRGGLANSTESHEIAQLRDELSEASYHVQSLVQRERGLRDQIQGLNDKLEASRDESQSLNEEFRSTNEELQTAKEEVESSNEELITINDELRSANDDLAKVSRDLRASGELTGAIVETMHLPLLVLNAALEVESANQAFLTDFQVNRSETLGRRVYDLGNREWDIPLLRRLLEEILPTNSTFDDFEVTHDFRSIGRRTMLLNARRLHEHGDKSRKIVLVIADITEQARTTQGLKELTADLARSNAELDQFASVASHDLQEPVRMMSNYIALLDRRYGHLFDDKAREFMHYVRDGATRMSEMIRAILSYSRIGHQSPDKIPIESSEALKSAMEGLSLSIQECHATIIADALPSIRASQVELTQLFQNLLGNALKFAYEGRPPVIRISAVESDTQWTFSVADNGIGMEEKYMDKIFRIFQRLHTSREVPGTGIGLATCKKIVEHHHGRIWVTSIPDQGSTFYFTLGK